MLEGVYKYALPGVSTATEKNSRSFDDQFTNTGH